MENIKICSKCKKELPATLEFFGPAKYKKSGLFCYCRICQSTYSLEYFKKNIQGNPEKWKHKVEHAKDYYHRDNGASEKQRQINRSLKNPLKMRALRMREKMKSHAKKLNVEYDEKNLTVDFLINLMENNKNCMCCNRIIIHEIRFNHKKAAHDTTTIDRINTLLGYVIDNIALICWKCNSLKSDGNIENFKNIVRYIEKYQK